MMALQSRGGREGAEERRFTQRFPRGTESNLLQGGAAGEAQQVWTSQTCFRKGEAVDQPDRFGTVGGGARPASWGGGGGCGPARPATCHHAVATGSTDQSNHRRSN